MHKLQKLDREFYNKDSIQLSKALLGKILVRELEEEKLCFKIVETEAYMGVTDKAAHSYGGKFTERTKVMFGKCGVAYIYMIYGMYNCFNVVASEEGNPQAVLIRAAEPVEGFNIISRLRYNKEFSELTKKEVINFANGPGKFCKAANMTKKDNGIDLCDDLIYFCDSNEEAMFDIVCSKRINIDYAEEARDYLWRFYIKDNKFVSKIDKNEIVL